MNEHQAVGAVAQLMARSPRHWFFTCADLERIVRPPWRLGQAVLMMQDQIPVGWGAYGLLSDEALEGLTSRQRKLEAADWDSGEHLWLSDIIAPYGHAKAIASRLRKMARERGHANGVVTFCRMRNGRHHFSSVAI